MLREIKKLREGETGIDRKKEELCERDPRREEKEEWMDGGGKNRKHVL